MEINEEEKIPRGSFAQIKTGWEGDRFPWEFLSGGEFYAFGCSALWARMRPAWSVRLGSMQMRSRMDRNPLRTAPVRP